jgi:hypothetical protein
MLPSIFGSSLSIVLIEYSKLLSYIGLTIVFGFAGLSALRLRKELRHKNSSKNNNFNQFNGQYLVGRPDEKNKKKEVQI